MLEKITIQLKHPICKCKIIDNQPEYGCNVGISNDGPFLEISCANCGCYFVVRGKEFSAYITIMNTPQEQNICSEHTIKSKNSLVKIPDNWKVIK